MRYQGIVPSGYVIKAAGWCPKKYIEKIWASR